AVASGDFNRDGFSDLIVSAPHEPQLNPLPGQIYLFLGSAKGLGKSAAWTIQGGQPGAGKAGFTLAVGDTTRDALRDLLVGMPGWNTAAGSNVGRAVLFLGGANYPPSPSRDSSAKLRRSTLKGMRSGVCLSDSSVRFGACQTGSGRGWRR